MRTIVKTCKHNRGFTLIELIVVMVIVSILAACIFVLFASLDKQSRVTAVNALEGRLRSASTIVHCQAVSEGRATAASSSTTLEGQSISLIYGYPSDISIASSGIQSGIQNAVKALQGFTASGSAPVVFSKDNAPTPANCSVSYKAAASSSASPTFTLTTSGC
jgi:MSHA pilin protein MshA